MILRFNSEVNELIWKKALKITGLEETTSLEELIRELIDLAE